MIRQITAILAAVALLSSSSYAQAQSMSMQLDVPFKLGLGEQATIESATVRFADIVQDSRCPSNVVCIWQGQATITVLVQSGDASAQELVLTIGADPSPSAAIGQYLVKLLGLEPYPQSSVHVDPEDYVATLVVSKATANSAGVFVRAAESGIAVIAGWNLERGKGTLVLLSRGDSGVTMSVARFTPAAVPCTVPDARECVDGQVTQATGTIIENATIHLEVDGNRLITSIDGVHSLDMKRIRTTGHAGPTVELEGG